MSPAPKSQSNYDSSVPATLNISKSLNDSGTLNSLCQETLSLDCIIASDTIQPRLYLNPNTTETYAALYSEFSRDRKKDRAIQCPLPPPDVFGIDDQFFMADGFHRLEAARQAGMLELSCHVYHGTHRDAMIHAAEANAHHGLPYSSGDKKRIIQRVLADTEIATLSNREIARRFGCTHTYVNRIKGEEEIGWLFDTAFQSQLETVSTSSGKRPRTAVARERYALAAMLGVSKDDLESFQRSWPYNPDHVRQAVIQFSLNATPKLPYDDAMARVAQDAQNVLPISQPTTPLLSPPEPSDDVRFIASRMALAIFDDGNPDSHLSADEVLASLKDRAPAFSAPHSGIGETKDAQYLRYADHLVTALISSPVAIAELSPDDIEMALDLFQDEADSIFDSVVHAWQAFRREISTLMVGQLYQALVVRLQEKRLEVDSTTARQIGTAVDTLTEHLKTSTDMETKAIRRTVQL